MDVGKCAVEVRVHVWGTMWGASDFLYHTSTHLEREGHDGESKMGSDAKVQRSRAVKARAKRLDYLISQLHY